MLADPLPIGSTYILNADIPRVSLGDRKATYATTVSSDKYQASISHVVTGTRRRTLVRLDKNTVVQDPLTDNVNVNDTLSAYLVIDRSETLATDTAVVNHVVELLGVLDAATFANVTTTRIAAIVGGQS